MGRGDRRGLAGAPARLMQGVWRVFATYVAAVAGIFAASGMAIVTLRSMFPDTPDQALLQSLPALIAGSLASSFALIFTLLAIVQPATPAALRLRPCWARVAAPGVMALGMLALGQTLDSLTWLVGFGERGSMVIVRRVLEGAVGPDLFGAVLVFGVIAGTAEELFFRGYMQTRLTEGWGPARAIVVSAACFGVLYLDISGVHMALAFAVGLYVGFVVEPTGIATESSSATRGRLRPSCACSRRIEKSVAASWRVTSPRGSARSRRRPRCAATSAAATNPTCASPTRRRSAAQAGDGSRPAR